VAGREHSGEKIKKEKKKKTHGRKQKVVGSGERGFLTFRGKRRCQRRDQGKTLTGKSKSKNGKKKKKIDETHAQTRVHGKGRWAGARRA